MAVHTVYYNNTEYKFDDTKGRTNWGSGDRASKSPTLSSEYSGWSTPAHDMATLTDKKIEKLIQRTINEGRVLSKDDVLNIAGGVNGDNKYAYYLYLISQNTGKVEWKDTNAPLPNINKEESTAPSSEPEPEEINDDTAVNNSNRVWSESMNTSYKSYLESLGITPEAYYGATAEEKLAYQEAWANTEGYVIKDGKAYKKEDYADTQVRDQYGNLLRPDDYVEDTPRGLAYNSYWNDLMSGGPATLGRQIQDNLTVAEQNAALSNLALADAQYQQASMQQAETVKAITDQVRAERMSRLRAGMNEAQIANQDMQMMLNNMNTLNQQANAMNANRLAAQQQYNLAQDTAYQQYLQQATNLGNIAAAMAAADAGDAYQQTLKRMYETGESYTTASKKVTGQTS